MKKIVVFLMAAAALVASSCDPKTENAPVEVYITLMQGDEIFAEDDVTVTLTTTDNTASYEAKTVAGVATFKVIPGLYNASASYRTSVDGDIFIYNGNVAVTVSAVGENSFELSLTESKTSQLVIKELYFAGCMDDNGEKAYRNDAYVILYNNSDAEIDVSDVGFTTALPYNSGQSNKYIVDGTTPLYFNEGWLPANHCVWWFTSDVRIPAYSQIVVALFGAINHTETYMNSVDLSSPDNYVMYDIESGYTSAKYAVADGIPESHYLKTYKYGKANAWAMSVNSPAFFILENADIEAFVKDPNNTDNTLGTATTAIKVKTEWTVDGIEVFQAGKEDDNQKRLPASVDAGSIYMTGDKGYSLYRNVDKEATEALPENEGKLVYNYAGGTDMLDEVYGNTDPSGIDAEASIANGAHIIYKDTNNSSADFHQRAVPSIKK